MNYERSIHSTDIICAMYSIRRIDTMYFCALSNLFFPSLSLSLQQHPCYGD